MCNNSRFNYGHGVRKLNDVMFSYRRTCRELTYNDAYNRFDVVVGRCIEVEDLRSLACIGLFVEEYWVSSRGK